MSIGKKAMVKIDSHEQVCTQRWEASQRAVSDVKNDIAGLHSLVTKGGATIIAALVAALWHMLSKGN